MSASELASAIFGTWFEASADGAFAVDRVTGVLSCANPRFAELLGHAGSLAGTSLDDLLPEETSRAELLASFGYRDHVAFRHAAGGLVYLTLTLAPITMPVGTACAATASVAGSPASTDTAAAPGSVVACLCRDATGWLRPAAERERPRTAHPLRPRASQPPPGAAQLPDEADLAQLVHELGEAKLQLEERNHEIAVLAGQVSRFGWRAAVGELIAGIAHHLNNPIGALASTLRRLEGQLDAVADAGVRGELHRMVQRSRAISRRIEGNVNTVMRAHEAGIADPTCQWLVLHREIETALAMFADRLDRVMVVRDYGDEPPVLVPHDSLHLVMSNLLDNSLRSMRESGTLMISVRSRAGEVAVRISDSGGGVPSEILPHLFEPLVSAGSGGAGLGLSTAQRLARSWGGDLVHVPSTSGCTFEIRIPLAEASDRQGGAASASPPGAALPLGALPLVPPRDYKRDLAPPRPQESPEELP